MTLHSWPLPRKFGSASLSWTQALAFLSGAQVIHAGCALTSLCPQLGFVSSDVTLATMVDVTMVTTVVHILSPWKGHLSPG
jgi:hypothetical protein